MATPRFLRGHRVLYHWRRLAEPRLRETLQTNRIYYSSPAALSDSRDCNPHCNTEILDDPEECKRYADWAVALPRAEAEQAAANIGCDERQRPLGRIALAKESIGESMLLALLLVGRVRTKVDRCSRLSHARTFKEPQSWREAKVGPTFRKSDEHSW